MFVTISFLMAVAPAVLLLFYYYNKNKTRYKSKPLIIKIFLLGIIYTLPVFGLEQILTLINRHFQWPRLLYYFFEAFIVAGLCEEYIKLRIVKTYAYPSHAFRTTFDGIMYTITAGLGFACMENIVYVTHGTLATAMTRGITAVPMHAVCSGMMGYYIGRARFAASAQERDTLLTTGLWIAIIIHGLYDFFIMIAPVYGSVFSSVAITLVAITFLRLRDRINQALQETPPEQNG